MKAQNQQHLNACDGILLASSKILSLVSKIDFVEYQENWLYQSGIHHQLLIISEAARKLSQSEKSKFSDISWQQIYSFGKVYWHEYQYIDHEIIWLTATQKIPELVKVISLMKIES